jgi:hypothetical protein
LDKFIVILMETTPWYVDVIPVHFRNICFFLKSHLTLVTTIFSPPVPQDSSVGAITVIRILSNFCPMDFMNIVKSNLQILRFLDDIYKQHAKTIDDNHSKLQEQYMVSSLCLYKNPAKPLDNFFQ